MAHQHIIRPFSAIIEAKEDGDKGTCVGVCISLMIKKSRLRWFGHVERKDDNDWVKRCITWEVAGMVWYGILEFNVPLDTV